MRLSAPLAAAALALTATIAPTGPAQAVPAVRFTGVQYDSPGPDNGSNTSLNAEWVRIKNTSNQNRSMSGWTIRDQQGHVYHFPSTYVLHAGASVKIHTGNGLDIQTNLYWHQNSYVWNNTGDRAILKKGRTHVDTCIWGDGSGYTNC